MKATAASLYAVAVMAALMTLHGAPAQSAAADPAEAEQGKKIYAEKCSHCHGPNMINSGTITPDLRRFPDDRTRFLDTVKNGKNNKMPPWGDILDDNQIARLWAYISSQRKP